MSGLSLALASSFRDRPLRPDLVAIGEVGLGGELRPVPQLDRRLAEARRLGFRAAVVPKRSQPEGVTGALGAASLHEAIGRVLDPDSAR